MVASPLRCQACHGRHAAGPERRPLQGHESAPVRAPDDQAAVAAPGDDSGKAGKGNAADPTAVGHRVRGLELAVDDAPQAHLAALASRGGDAAVAAEGEGGDGGGVGAEVEDRFGAGCAAGQAEEDEVARARVRREDTVGACGDELERREGLAKRTGGLQRAKGKA